MYIFHPDTFPNELIPSLGNFEGVLGSFCHCRADINLQTGSQCSFWWMQSFACCSHPAALVCLPICSVEGDKCGSVCWCSKPKRRKIHLEISSRLRYKKKRASFLFYEIVTFQTIVTLTEWCLDQYFILSHSALADSSAELFHLHSPFAGVNFPFLTPVEDSWNFPYSCVITAAAAQSSDWPESCWKWLELRLHQRSSCALPIIRFLSGENDFRMSSVKCILTGRTWTFDRGNTRKQTDCWSLPAAAQSAAG